MKRRLRGTVLAFASLAAFVSFSASASAAPTFAPPINFGTGSGPAFPAVADFNEDGDLDIAVAIRNNDRIEVRLGNGDGTFAGATNFATGDAPDEVLATDINLDSNVDLLVTNSGIGDSTITILLGDGAGGFTSSSVSLAPQDSIIRVTVGLIDGDTFPDIAATSVNPSNVSILLGNGDGTFDPPTVVSSGGVNPVGVAIALIDGDANTDLIVMNNASHNFAVLLGDGLGGFGPPTTYSTGSCFPDCSPGTALVKDFNGDGFLDVVTEVGFPPAGSVSVSLGNGDGTFDPFTLYSTGGGGGPNNTVTADFDGDGNLDLATSNVSTGDTSVLTGNGDGTFNPGVVFATGSGPVGLETADFNGDGKPDLAVANHTANTVSILLNTTADTTDPTLNLPADITVEADGPDGSEVTFTVTATDDTDPNPSVSCTPPSGSLFPIGTTIVNCTATDASGNVANGSFNVTVTDTARADLEIDKTASHLKASPGQSVTYTFTVTNHGPSTAHNVTVRDPGSKHLEFLSGDPGCSVVASEIVCNFGSLASGATASKNVVLRLHASHHQGEAPSQHDLDVLKFEQFVEAEPNGALPYDKFSLSCPDGYTATDGSARTDAVQSPSDNAEHPTERLHVVRSESNAVDRKVWDFTLQNHTPSQAQAHLFIVCLRDETSDNDGHFHAIVHHPRQTGTLVIPATGGRHEITRTCPINTVAIAPSFDFVTVAPAGNPDGPHGPQYKSIQSADGRSWTWGFQTAAAARVEVSIRCIGRETSSAGGHFESLQFHHVYKRVDVAPYAGDGNSGPWTEARAECPVHYKGITATWRYPKHVKPYGNTPEPINRDFRIFNKSPLVKYAHIDLNCLKIRTADDLNGGSVRNHASVSAAESAAANAPGLPDWNFGNNLDFCDLEDPPLGDGSGRRRLRRRRRLG